MSRDFETTRWSLVLAAREGQEETARTALSELYRTYWPPLYWFVRSKGHGPEEAEDLLQSYFVRLLERDYLHDIKPGGRLRSFLLASLTHFLSNEWERARALKRGGGKTIVSLDFASAERRYRFEPVESTTPEKIYERRWALSLLEKVLERLAAELEERGQGRTFEHLKEYLTARHPIPSYRDVAKRLAMSEGAVKVRVHRLRRRFAVLLMEEVAETVSSADEAESELRHLLTVV